MTEKKINSLGDLGPYISNTDNSKNIIYIQGVPEICKTQACVVGVDEAGRGPVLGPMVYGVAFCPKSKTDVLVDLGCADSKSLTEEKRELIFDDIQQKEFANSCIGWGVEIISPCTISESMNRKTKHSLNEISMDSAIGLIHQLVEAGVNIDEIYVDTVGPPEKYQEKLKSIFPYFNITVAKKADSTYPIVSAASICAKVVRDNSLKVWKFKEGIDITYKQFGSGYPGDPVTKNFLMENMDLVFGFPRLVRFSWSTAEKALHGKVFDVFFDESDDKSVNKKCDLKKFFKGQDKDGNVIREPHYFFKDRFLNDVTEL
ncbi:ribonuclease H2 subunit A [Condylostylus longicornis]|uniref:ribonuclease H2 subunit A n=1 Tax=Condylostylus longicornis TaxID=2530218 RepID=UPI00244E0317|nr:ribonuclease H2 subunit A [Condylostylus longicornis]